MSYIERSNTPTYTGGSNVNNGSQRPYSVNNPFRNASTDSSINQYKSDLEFQNWVRENQQVQSGSASQGQPFYSRPAGNRSTGSFRSYHSNNSRNSGAFYEDDIIDHYKRSDSPVHMMGPPPSSTGLAVQRNGTVRSTNSVGSNGMNRNNPFLTEDQEGYNLTDSRVSPLKNQVPQPYEQRQQQQSQQYPSAREEKERMRQRYLGEENAQPQPPHRSRAADAAVADLPPSYAEVAQSYNKSKLPKPTDSKHASSSRNRSGSNGDMLNQRPSQHRSSGHSHSHHHHHHNREESGTKHRSSSSSKKKSKTTKPVIAKNVDTIDKLDVTGLFGGAFHHDGPFDACTPHRNKNTKVAPVLAFPKDGPNTSLAGTVPADRSYNKKMNQVFGTQNVDEDADADEEIYYSSNTPMTRRGKNGEILKNGGNSGTAKISSLQQRPSYNQKYSIPSYTGSSSSMSPPSTSIMASPSTDTIAAVKNNSSVHNFDTKQRDKVHGPLSQGLGSTTFLDGAPAAASAIKDDMAHRKNVQLNRKKSISQRLGITSPHPENKNSIVDSSTSGTLQKTRSDGPMRYLNDHDHDDDDDDEVYHSGTGTRFNSANDEYLSGAKKESSGNKFLRRVKTLKVGRKN